MRRDQDTSKSDWTHRPPPAPARSSSRCATLPPSAPRRCARSWCTAGPRCAAINNTEFRSIQLLQVSVESVVGVSYRCVCEVSSGEKDERPAPKLRSEFTQGSVEAMTTCRFEQAAGETRTRRQRPTKTKPRQARGSWCTRSARTTTLQHGRHVAVTTLWEPRAAERISLPERRKPRTQASKGCSPV